jgi:ribosome-binding ATPase
VLIHIVDASGKSDDNGNVVDGGDVDKYRADYDHRWIKAELHQWIYGNIKAKWGSVVRKSIDRLYALFTGYRGTKQCVDVALARAELNPDMAATWSDRDIHSLVANYLSVRFPLVVCMNKLDQIEGGMTDIYQNMKTVCEAVGERAVPCSALVANWELLRSGTSYTPSTSSKDIELKLQYNLMMDSFGSTGVIDCLSEAVALLRPVVVYPVENLETDAEEAIHCVYVKPYTSVFNLYESLKRGDLKGYRLAGDFVRAEGRGAQPRSPRRQLGRDTIIDESCNILHIQTNKKSIWQCDF